MNILFVNYGDFTSNSLNHIAGFANALSRRGHACIVAIPDRKSTISAILQPQFTPALFEELLEHPLTFPDGRGADVIHAWTPREIVRKFVIAYQARTQEPARLLVHLEDNERTLLESFTGVPFEEFRTRNPREIIRALADSLPHPLRHEAFLLAADGITVIIEELLRFVPSGLPSLVLPPGVDASIYFPQPPDENIRREFGLPSEEKIIAYTGSVTFANEAEIRDLYDAVVLLNERGVPTKLIRTGITPPTFDQSLSPAQRRIVVELGFIDKAKLPKLLALSDVLVQPGKPGPFNDYRLPSKLPEFFASGRPVILPRSNLGTQATNEVDALVLETGSPEEIANACQRVFAQPELARTLSKNGIRFARNHFDLEPIVDRLVNFYDGVLNRPSPHDWKRISQFNGSEIGVLADRVQRSAAELPSTFREQLELLALLVNELEDSFASSRQNQVNQELRDQIAYWKTQFDLTKQHITHLETVLGSTQGHTHNIEEALTATRTHAQNLEQALNATRNHAEDLERALNESQSQSERIQLALAEGQLQVKHMEEQVAYSNSQYELLKQQSEESAKKFKDEAADWKVQHETIKRRLDHTEQSLALTRNHAEMLQVSLDTARAETKRSEQIQHRLEGKLHDARTHAHELSVQILGLKTEISRIDDLVVQANLRQRDLLYQRDEKIRQMTNSFSWKATAWLRALRRRFVDPTRRKQLEPAPLPPPTHHQRSGMTESFGQVSAQSPVAPAFRYCLDYPQSWTFKPSKIVIRGWCFAADESKVIAVRARIGERIYPANMGLKRLDVLAALRDFPQAEYCGFKIEIEIALNDAEIVIEAANETGAFNTIVSHPMVVTQNGGIEDLSPYQKWITAYATLSLADRDAQRGEVETWKNPPLVSIVVPVYNTPERWLRLAVESVQAQTYRHWELCLADDASPDKHVKPLLADLAKSDPRIKVVYREKNGHISAASNSALAIATGELLALLDHDDELAPNALFETVSAFRANPTAVLVYSDEDKIDEEGHRLDPYFKPDYLPDLYVSQNYISHLSVYRIKAVRDVGGFREGYEGSQDWDLALRVIDHVGGDKVIHVPKVLYHWRAIPGSTALLLSEKNYPLEAARKALTDHFVRKQQPVALITVPGDHWRIKYPLPSPAPRVALIIPTRNRVNLLSHCVDSILEKTRYPNFEVVVVDNASDDPATLTYFEQLKKRGVRILPFPGPFNYSAINNFAVQQVEADIVGLLNNDLEVIHGDWLEEMASQAARPEIGCVGAMLYYPTDRIQHAGVIVGMGGVAGHAFRDYPRGTPGVFNRARLAQNFSAVTAACLLIRRSTYLKVGGLDEKALAVAFNDVDFCLKVRAAGYWNLWTPFAELYHHESASRGADDTPEKSERFAREVQTMLARWPHEIANDPAYNHNLSLDQHDFTLAIPPRQPKAIAT